MSFLHNLAELTENCRKEYEQLKTEIQKGGTDSLYKCEEAYLKDRAEQIETCGDFNIFAHGDNLSFISYLLGSGMAGKLDLVYIDPPFFSKADYNVSLQVQSDKFDKPLKLKHTAYTDNWNGGMEDYLRMIALRLFLIRDLLSDTGCMWVHLDWHAAHYVKLLLDEIFGEENFVNEVIWTYKSGGTTNKRFARKHDTLFFYGKSQEYFFEAQKEKSYNRGMKPYRFKGVEEFEDELGWYTLVNMKDVWQMDMVGRTSSERTGYATQKPEALLERILKSCTKEGNLCADFFGGSGTLAAAAEKMNRRWIVCDKGNSSAAAIRKRMINLKAEFIVLGEAEKQQKKAKAQTWQDGVLGLSVEKAKAENPELEKLKAENAEAENQEAGKSLKISIEKYEPAENVLAGFKLEDRAELSEALKKDPLCLIESWSVDFDYDGNVHKPQEIRFRTKGKIENGIEIKFKDEINKCISIKCIDVWGNEVKETVKL